MITALLLHIACIEAVDPYGDTPTPEEEELSGTDSDDLQEDSDAPEEDSGGQAEDSDAPEEDSGEEDPEEEPPAEIIDYEREGSHDFVSESIQFNLDSDCSSQVTLLTPLSGGNGTLVILSHGLQRGTTQMEGWGQHYASWGLTVAIPQLCHASVLDADAQANADELIALRQQLGHERVLYAGHSAGALASLLAAKDDSDALGLLTLDLVDDYSELGADAAPALSVPAYGLFAEASSCNASSNGKDVYRALPQGEMIHISESDHCDYEYSTDWLCTWFCDYNNTEFSDDEIREEVLGFSTSALVGMAGMDPVAIEHWWQSGGTFYDAAKALGSIQ